MIPNAEANCSSAAVHNSSRIKNEFHDDTTVVVLRLRERLTVNLLTDAREHAQREEKSVMSTDSASKEINASVRDGQELQKLVDQLERYLGNGMMSLGIKGQADSVSELIDLLAEQASDVNILFLTGGKSGLMQTADQSPDGSVIPEAVLRLRQLLADAGKTVTLRIC